MAANPVATINTQLLNLIAFLGTSGTFTVTKTGATSTVVGLISPMDRRDEELIQSYGVNASRLTFNATGFAGVRPVRYDTWTAAGRKYVFETVAEQIVKGEVIGYFIYCKGTVG